MTHTTDDAPFYNAFEISPVPPPGPDATPPDVYRGIYGMPMFVTIPTADLTASVDFWTRGLGFIDLFTTPGVMSHMRRWAFQDALLVAGEPADGEPAMTVSFSCVLSELDAIADACEKLVPDCTTGPRAMPWPTVDLEVRTPENTRVIITAARGVDPRSDEAQALREAGYGVPDADEEA
ncbi:VOC family protein [Paramicrobacterium agarici]|uniref:VOC family protein n=1 Tax=Paramicrobacterium agarici TaxID=630514 RepID=UPI00114EF48E|nr:VOC family protein [Microbacterium agarici]TQO22575.1 hypothetical protein FB385_1406 [Microbacterium agarici]